MAGIADVFIRTGGDDPKQGSWTIGPDAKINIFGVGNGGINGLQNIIRSGLSDADFYAVNSEADISWIDTIPSTNIIVIGNGKGTSCDPNIGKDAAIAASEKIADALRGSDILVISACMGGGTGTGASNAIAKIARDMGIFSVGVVTMPFELEGRRRSNNASEGIESLKDSVDALMVIPNDRLLATTDKKEPIFKMFDVADTAILKVMQCIMDTIKASKDGGSNVTELIKAIEAGAEKI